MSLPFLVVQSRCIEQLREHCRGRQQQQQAFKFFDLHESLISLFGTAHKASAIGQWYCKEIAVADFTSIR